MIALIILIVLVILLFIFKIVYPKELPVVNENFAPINYRSGPYYTYDPYYPFFWNNPTRMINNWPPYYTYFNDNPYWYYRYPYLRFY